MSCFLLLGVIKNPTTATNHYLVCICDHKTFQTKPKLCTCCRNLQVCSTAAVPQGCLWWDTGSAGIEQSERATQETWKEIFTREDVPGWGRDLKAFLKWQWPWHTNIYWVVVEGICLQTRCRTESPRQDLLHKPVQLLFRLKSRWKGHNLVQHLAFTKGHCFF